MTSAEHERLECLKKERSMLGVISGLISAHAHDLMVEVEKLNVDAEEIRAVCEKLDAEIEELKAKGDNAQTN